MLWVVGGIVGAVRRAVLRRARGGLSALGRRIQLPVAHLSSRRSGFIAGWISATVGFAAPVALAAMAFGEYFQGVMPGRAAAAAGLAVVWLVTLVHLSGVRHGSTFQNVSTLLKIAADRRASSSPASPSASRSRSRSRRRAADLELHHRARRSRSASSSSCTPIRAGTRRPTSPARCATRSATCRARCSSRR